MSSLQSSIEKFKSPLNKSKSKAMFSFPKQPRFAQKINPGSTFYYDQPSTLTSRAAGFGYGKKTDISKQNLNSPGPNRYNIKPLLEESTNMGTSFGIGRAECKNISPFRNSEAPGPGNYGNPYQTEFKQMTIRQKVKLPALFPQVDYPGPGTYDFNATDAEFKTNSKYNSVLGYSITKSPEKENTAPKVALGPGYYQTAFSSTGKQFLAHKKSESGFVFKRQERQTLSLNSVSPGPGAYQHFSEISN